MSAEPDGSTTADVVSCPPHAAVAAFEAAPVALAVFDANNRLVAWNPRWAALTGDAGVAPRAGQSFMDWLRDGLARACFTDAIGREDAWLAERIAQHGHDTDYDLTLAGNRRARIEERRTRDGGLLIRATDVEIAAPRTRTLDRMFEANPIPLAVIEAQSQRFLAANRAFLALYGYDRAELLAMTTDALVDNEGSDDLDGFGLNAADEEVVHHRTADGTPIEVCVHSCSIEYDGRAAVLVAMIDVTERRRNEAHIVHLAHHDTLTDLANRTLFHQRLDSALTSGRAPGRGVALHCIDLDGFKAVNDTLGHPIGDSLLRIVAERLRRCVRRTDTVARMGGDEFALLQDPVDSAADASALASRIVDELSSTYVIKDQQVRVSASVGIAVATDRALDPYDLLTQADIALYNAKNDGRRTFRFYEPAMDAAIKARRDLEDDLRRAAARDEFVIHYQPWTDIATNRIEGFEALVRWNHPERGLIRPADFIPLAEETGLIASIGEWVLHHACAEAALWPNDVSLAVNLSSVQFRNSKLVDTTREALERSGFPGHRLEVEITETVVLEDNKLIHETLSELRSMGVRIAVDDFGTGYSSLKYLRCFPFSKVKVDRSFVKELPHDLDCITIVRGIVEVANGLGMITTAEGVETAEQLYMLRSNGCGQAQGFLFGRPMPAAEVAELLAGDRIVAVA
ncbi:EAL domain-containing protein [Rhodoplanes sp. TEM]|uniref:EAL domain-containing protein n=1 Tax=Rhodoplanes tepidamans TaxID=200616 RepID=A0ABT5JAY0_RHOTP|nr:MULTISPECIES: EAL domain-containing protein [Rhodoplanes]MDC7786840.1 EAL domain-containing protein [Rhodoplanes tepidamans]MDC7984231.1 EAL domain-containing protein [Rhodoplanes sp. TEM]MDQ0355968.1 diguanylate cyclase (GGDEF)-like protein/PAS domain S-box-containing protein [Rhodoplanes tepidamans]